MKAFKIILVLRPAHGGWTLLVLLGLINLRCGEEVKLIEVRKDLGDLHETNKVSIRTNKKENVPHISGGRRKMGSIFRWFL